MSHTNAPRRRFGTAYGGFVYPSTLPGLDASSVVYCVGVGEDVSHDVAVSRALGGATVHLFDPTPRAVTHVAKVVEALRTGVRPANDKREGGGDATYWDQLLDASSGPMGALVLHAYALDAQDGERFFYPPANPEYVSHSFFETASRAPREQALRVECKCMASTLRQLGHARVDLLKIDIEGAEIDVLGQLFNVWTATSDWPLYLSVDFDSARCDSLNGGRRAANAVIERLRQHYTVYHNNHWDISFVRRDV